MSKQRPELLWMKTKGKRETGRAFARMAPENKIVNRDRQTNMAPANKIVNRDKQTKMVPDRETQTKTGPIADISHHRHHWRWCTFFKPVCCLA